MFKNLLSLAMLLGLAYIFYTILPDFQSSESLNTLATEYAAKGPDKPGAANLVTAVVVTYRGLDTLGEVSILFLSAAIVSFLLKANANGRKRIIRPVSEVLQTAAKVLVPSIFLLGIYVFINGHLSPGGGFQGGAILASGFVLMLLARPDMSLNHKLISAIESVSGFSFVIIGILGIFLAGGFLDNSILPLGDFGSLISAGAIPIIYLFIGLKVGAELSTIVSNLQESQNQV